MFDSEYARLAKQHTPSLNPDLARGLAVKHFKELEPYMDSLFRAISRGFPEDLHYVRGERCSPQEEYNYMTKRKHGSKRYYDASRSRIYTMAYTFRYEGEEIRRYMYLPIVGDGGVTYMSGSRFVISPVLSDRVISVETKDIFIRFRRGKATFSSTYGYFRADGLTETMPVVHGKIYNRKPQANAPRQLVRGNCTLVHYLFCKYGFKETFTRFVGAVPIVGTPEQITLENYPRENWVICDSAGIKPRTMLDKTWKASMLRVAVPREHYDHRMKSYLAGFFYVLDHFPARLTEQVAWLDNTRLWTILMGHLIFGGHHSEGQLADNIDDHIYSLDEYVDEVMRARFREIKMPVDDIYQIFHILIENFTEWLLVGSKKINSLYEKELNVLDYIMEDVMIAINTFYYKLTAAAQSKREAGKKLRKEDIVKLMDKYLRPGRIFSITRQHQEVSTTSTSGDNMALKITTLMVPQSKLSKKGHGKDNGAMTDPAKFLHVSVAEVGGYANLTKSDPSGHSRLNLCTKIDSKGMVIRNPDLLEITERVQEEISQ